MEMEVILFPGTTIYKNKHNLLIYFMSLTVKQLVDGATVTSPTGFLKGQN